MQFPFVGGAYEGYSRDLNAQRCVNLYPVLDQEGGKVPIALYGTPGCTLFCDTGGAAPLRCMHVFGAYLFAVVGSGFYRITTAGVATSVGTLDTSTGVCYMEHNSTQLMVVDGTYGYIWDSATLTKIADADFPSSVGTLAYQDGYFIVTRNDTGQFWISALNNGTSWDATKYTTAEGQPDNLVRIISDHRELWAFGTQTTEIFYNSGATFPFVRKIDEILERGCIASASVAKEDNTIFWLDDRGMARRAEGYKPTVISTRNIEYQWSTYSTLSDAIGFCYVQGGHTFWVLTFPTANKTWAFDASTNMWHERMSSFSYTDGRWRANCYVYFDTKHLIGDHTNGKIYELSMETYAEDSEVLRAIRRAPVIHDDRKHIFHHSMEIEFEAGVGISGTATGSDPQAMLRWSDDGGHTWGNEHWADIGKIGEYGKRARWKKLGRSRNRVYEVTISDPVKRVIVGAYLDASKGVN